MENKYEKISELLINFGTSDKNTIHKYGIMYDLIFNSQFLKMGRKLKVLEIGITLYGEGSVKPFSQISYLEKYVGIDNVKYEHQISNEKVKLYSGPEYDAYNLNTIKFLEENEGKFDIIIDDGPHYWDTQKWFLQNYDKLLTKGGVLICEDIGEQHVENLKNLRQTDDIYIIDLRMVNNINKDEIIAIKYND